ncbi:MAG: ion transporter [Candidatus Marinimicrobia bacterium]|nr:ion transporter [Candidatus Neomarinimicrobiota bacterium]MBT4370724.1 ion transporter [Candidatus Neomarinimicrobiota bacterium]MBT7372447.1 ion transporter [Candidatus Neomarinimicrobiota bacterium]
MSAIRDKIKVIIFGTDTRGGKLFDVVLIITIILSIITVLLDSVAEYSQRYETLFNNAEWIFTILFTIEYLLRIYCIRLPTSYIFSFFGIIDFLALIPTYLSMILPGAEVLTVIRVLRVLRVFRVLKLVQFMGEADLLMKAMLASRRKIFVFLFSVMNVVIILGSVMYLIEGEVAGFTSIPRSIYWAIVTLTTVGYGDISPMTNLGQSIAALIMIIGYSIIAIPTGIVTSEINFMSKEPEKIECIVCGDENQNDDSKFCSSCGSKLTNQK